MVEIYCKCGCGCYIKPCFFEKEVLDILHKHSINAKPDGDPYTFNMGGNQQKYDNLRLCTDYEVFPKNHMYFDFNTSDKPIKFNSISMFNRYDDAIDDISGIILYNGECKDLGKRVPL